MLKLLPRSPKNTQANLFHNQLRDMLDSNDPLFALADTINWEQFDDSFEKYYSENGRPAKPIRLMVGILLLKQIENLSEEQWQTYD